MAARKARILDACAILAWLLDERGAAVVDDLLADSSNRCLATAINACEVYYDLHRRGQETNAASLDSLLISSGIEIVDQLPADLWKEAGRLKATLRRVSLADCFAVALARQEGGDLVTSDHHELDQVADAGLVQILFIR